MRIKINTKVWFNKTPGHIRSTETFGECLPDPWSDLVLIGVFLTHKHPVMAKSMFQIYELRGKFIRV